MQATHSMQAMQTRRFSTGDFMLTQVSNAFFAVALVLAGCGGGKDTGPALPPATGASSPPLPALPAVSGPAAATSATSAPGAASAAIASTRRSTGTLLPHSEVAVVARSRGVVVAMTVDVGARVEPGKILFRVDGREAALRLTQAQTQLAAARQELAGIEVEYHRTQKLLEQQAATPQQWDRVSAQHDAAKVGVAQAQSSVAIAGKAVTDTTVVAPIGGVVVARRVALGDYVTDGAQALVVQDQARLDLRFRLPDRALQTTGVGDAITVSLPALGVTRKATISLVAPSVDPRTRTIELTAVLDNRDGRLRPGLMADVEFDAKLASASTH
jgi:membrane fusion protein (multidrug efflux system)